MCCKLMGKSSIVYDFFPFVCYKEYELDLYICIQHEHLYTPWRIVVSIHVKRSGKIKRHSAKRVKK